MSVCDVDKFRTFYLLRIIEAAHLPAENEMAISRRLFLRPNGHFYKEIG